MASLPARLPRPRAILFDWDNTLIDSWATIHEALNVVMAEMGRPLWSLAETRERVRLSLRESFPAHFGDDWRKARGIYLEAYSRIHLERLATLPGSAELLAALAGAGVFLGVVSNKTGAILRREVERLGWTELFGSVVGAGDAAADKPNAAPVLLALGPSGVTAGDAVWFVGDTEVDVECAVNSGCVPILLGEGATRPAGGAAPRLIFAEGAALFRFFEGL
jgi:phosphoglycolate phosphatase